MEILSLVLGIVGALAWFPTIYSWLRRYFQKIRFVYLDRHIVYNANCEMPINGNIEIKYGMIFVIALNFYVNWGSFFPDKVICEIELNDGAIHKANLYEGKSYYSDTSLPPMLHVFNFPDRYNFNLNRSILCNKDNIRIIPFFFENINLKDDSNIKTISIIMKKGREKKKIVFSKKECVAYNLIHKYDRIIGEYK